MKKIFPSSQYKKDYKRYRHNPRKVAALREVIEMLENEQPIPKQYLPHMLIEGDFRLIWIDEQRNIIELVRLGTHSELFG